MFQYSCTVKNLQHSPAACAENSLLYTRIETFSYTTRVKKPMSAQRPNSKDTLQFEDCRFINRQIVLKIPFQMTSKIIFPEKTRENAKTVLKIFFSTAKLY